VHRYCACGSRATMGCFAREDAEGNNLTVSQLRTELVR
jgi:hypothetical protein